MKYKTVAVLRDSSALDKKVNKLLEEGWELYGNPYSRECYTFQALTRTIQNENKEEPK